MTVVGKQEARQSLLVDALRLSPAWGWDFLKIDFNDQAGGASDSGKSVLEFYTCGFPLGMEQLMTLHPEVIRRGQMFSVRTTPIGS
jgi:hypothetical protein